MGVPVQKSNWSYTIVQMDKLDFHTKDLNWFVKRRFLLKIQTMAFIINAFFDNLAQH